MNLIVDAGNSKIKLAIFRKSILIHDEPVGQDDFVDAIRRLFKTYPNIDQAIVSNVGALTTEQIKVVSVFCKTHELSHRSRIPFKNSYTSPHTLGVDRIALIAAAYYRAPHSNTLVIDAGSCITFDVINDFDEYLGGAISPGIQMRYVAMNKQTANLPALEKAEVMDFIGNSTENCMHSGVINGISNEIDGAINQYKSRFKDLTVILTGGDAQFLSKRLKNTIFADSKFLLKGLNCLLEYNKY